MTAIDGDDSGVKAGAQPDDVAPLRQCARCRQMFPVEAGVHPMELLGWWTCPACTDALLPGQHRST